MNIEEIRTFCLNKAHVTEEFPFDETTLVFKVAGKIFVICGLDTEILSLNLKCQPDKAIELREEFNDILPGFHMNKKHWNTVNINGDVSEKLLIELINHSYDLVVLGLPKNKRTELNL